MTNHPAMQGKQALYYLGSLTEFYGQQVITWRTQPDGRLTVLLESGAYLQDCRPTSLNSKRLRAVDNRRVVHRVTVQLQPQHPVHTDYPLCPGDIVVKHDDGTWGKTAPGLAINGFTLTPEQEATLELVEVITHSPLHYEVVSS